MSSTDEPSNDVKLSSRGFRTMSEAYWIDKPSFSEFGRLNLFHLFFASLMTVFTHLMAYTWVLLIGGLIGSGCLDFMFVLIFGD